MAQKRGLFIAFEGSEGAGKTTVTTAVAEALEKRGIEVVRTREPGSTPLGEKIRDLLLHQSHENGLPIGSKAELLLFLAARAQNLEEVIKPALERGACVLCDRFNDSTIAYQGCARGLGLEDVQHLCSWVCQEILPDITFFLEIDPKIGLERTHKISAFDRIESEAAEFHSRVQEGFKKIAALHPDHFTRIDADREKNLVIEDVWKVIASKLGL